MNSQRAKITKKNKGFTIIELLIVIVIIGLLASVIVPSLNNARKKARDGRRISDIKQIQLALEMYLSSNTTYPGEYPDTVATLVPTYLPTEPKDPSTGLSYPYDNYTNSSRGTCVVATGSCTYYHLGATLENINNTVLGVDRDVNNKVDSGPDGLSTLAACAADAGATTATDVCYDVTP